MFVVLEGPNGAGKSTVGKLLKDRLLQAGRTVHLTREPTASALGQFVRGAEADYSGRTLALLVAADRSEHVYKDIVPSLSANDVVLCDRYVPSSLVLQRMDGLEIQEIMALNSQFPVPNLTVFLTCAPRTSRDRLTERSSLTRFEQDDLRQEHNYYADAMAFLGERGWPVISVDTEARTPRETTALVWHSLYDRL